MTRTRDPGFPGFAERLLILLRGIAALTGLALMTAGFPAAMFVVAPRLDLSIPTWTGIVTTLTRPDDGTLFLRTLAVIAWAAWAAFLGCVVLELGCLARRIATPTLPALGWPQAVAASLIAAIVVMLMPTTRATAAPARPGIVATAVHTPTQTIDPPHPVRDQHIPSAPSARPSTPGQAVIEVTVQDGDTLWDLAERHLGHGPRYADIADLNYGRPQPDGRTLTHSHWLTPGWKLLVPDETPPSRHPATSRATSPRTPNRTYVVQPHDTLWDIAEARLGDGNRYREIAVLNLHRPQPDGGRLTDVDLIQPGWILQLPPAAVHRPTRDATGQTTSQPDRRATPEADRQATAEPDRQATAQARPSDGPQVSRSQEATASPSTTTAPSPTSTPTTPAHATDAEGIHLNGSFITWTLASAITSAIALAWLQRRRRYNPEDPTDADDDPTTLPEPLPTIHHDTLTHADTPTPTDLADRAADVPPQPHPTTGGLGLIGDGADAAARAALIAAHSAGGPRDPDRRTEVVIDRPTLTRLLTSPDNAGPVSTSPVSTSPVSTDAAEIQPWPRLHLADTPDDAVSLIETELLRRARILDDDQAPDLATLRIHVPDEEPLPPILLITPTPTTDTHARIRAALALGVSMDTTAVLLGPWDDGITLHIAADGHAAPTTGHDTASEAAPAPDGQNLHHEDGEDEKIAVLDPETTAALLVTLREAHTGEPPANGSRIPPEPLASPDDNVGGEDASSDAVRNGAT
ncbi:MAG: hypothetical protein QG597_4157, partial [Actinomycetota bacterium]|nr:hypothetical protein [Actinomycetota bacterium]